MFDKELYWKRRNRVTVTKNKKGEITSATPAPLPGMPSLIPKPKLAKWAEEDYKKGKCDKERVGMERTSGVMQVMIGKTFVSQNRRQRRRRVINRNFTKANYAFGVKIGSKEFNIITHRAKKDAKDNKLVNREIEARRIKQVLKHDPKKSNKQRLLERREAKANAAK